MYRASDRIEHREWLSRIRGACERLGLGREASATASDIFLSQLPDAERSKAAVAATSVYAGALIAGEQRSQTEVAESMGVTRISIQSRWKEVLENAGFRPPDW